MFRWIFRTSEYVENQFMLQKLPESKSIVGNYYIVLLLTQLLVYVA
jgi:hypothetical protein